MSRSRVNQPKITHTAEVIKVIREAWQAGRVVVPVLGSGISADSGIPTIFDVVRYLARFRHHVQHRVYLPPAAGRADDLLGAQAEKYRKRMLSFVQDHGWPDLHQLTEEMWHFLDQAHGRQASRAALDKEVV